MTYCEVLTFVKGDERATIATSGCVHMLQRGEGVKEFKTLSAAIASLEADGYSILIDMQKGV